MDASAAVEFLLGTQRGARLVPLVHDHGDDLHAPSHFVLEVLHVVRRLVRTDLVSLERAEGVLEDLSELPVTTHDPRALAERIWALRDNVTPSDAAYVALAEGLHAPLVTADGRLARAPKHQAEVLLL